MKLFIAKKESVLGGGVKKGGDYYLQVSLKGIQEHGMMQ